MAKDSKEDHLRLVRQRYKDASEAMDDNREESKVDRLMVAGQQWDDASLKEREGRPCLVINKLAGTTKQIIGDQRQNKPSIKVSPVDSDSDPDTAEILTGLIRNIEQQSDAESCYDTSFEQAVYGGYGFFRINTEYSEDSIDEQDIVFERILDPDSVTFDQFCKRQDRADARFCFVEETLPIPEFEEKYPDITPADWEATYNDDDSQWYTGETIRVAEYFYLEDYTKTLYRLETGETVDGEKYAEQVVEEGGQKFFIASNGQPIAITKERIAVCQRVKWELLTGHEVIDTRDWPGKYIPIVGVFGAEMWADGKLMLKSSIRDARDPQRVYNWMRSTSVETVAQAPRQPYMVSDAQLEGHEEQWDNMHRTPQAYLKYNHVHGEPAPMRIGGSIPDVGAQNESAISADDIKATTGIFGAALGEQTNETSGRAIIARQREGDVATFTFVDNLTRALRHAGRILVDLIPRIYDTERVVRVLGEDGAEEFAEVNQIVIDPRNGKPVVLNDLSRGKYDVIVSVGPAYSTQRVEAAEAMMGLAKVAPQFGQFFIDLIAENLDWPGADKIAERAKKMLPPEMKEENDEEEKTPEQQQQEQQMQQQQEMGQQLEQEQIKLSMEKMDLDNEKMRADISRVRASIELDARKLQSDMETADINDESEVIKQDGYELDNIQKGQDIVLQPSSGKG
jgi:hypothetical protein